MNPTDFLEFLHSIEQLKYELRHSWHSSGRQESVAEHTFRLLVMAFVLEKKIDADMSKVMKMLIVHDFGEFFLRICLLLKERLLRILPQSLNQ